MKITLQILIFLAFIPAYSQLSLANIFSDNMVLQRDEPIKIWGTGNPGERITLNFSNEMVETLVNADSTWQAVLKKQEATNKPKSLLVQSFEEEIIIKNIFIGDIWLLIGQSNMEWPMKLEMHFEEAKRDAQNSRLRFYNPLYIGKNIYGTHYNESQLKQLKKGELFQEAKWEESDTSSFKNMSAVGYYFAREIINTQNIPVGLINLSIGGAPLETFIDEEALKRSQQFSSKAKENWLENDILPVWVRERGIQNIGNTLKGDKNSFNHAYRPGFAFNSGIKPLLQIPIKGVLWYQGESNAQEIERVEEYPELQALMIKDYRKQWKNENLPFYWVQLSSIDTTNYQSHFWPEFRDGQRRLANKMGNVGMAVSSDIGNRTDIHPRNKKEVGKRLARWALAQVYEKNIVVAGPLPKKAVWQDNLLIVDFEHTARGLKTLEGNLTGFSLDGKNYIEAIIKENKVHIKTPQKPDYIFYGWAPFSEGNLLNSENLPASTFKIKVE